MLTLLFRYELLTHIIESKCDCISLVFAPWMTAEARTRQTRLTWLHSPPALARSLIARDRSTLASSLSVLYHSFIAVANSSDLSPAAIACAQARVVWRHGLKVRGSVTNTTHNGRQDEHNETPTAIQAYVWFEKPSVFATGADINKISKSNSLAWNCMTYIINRTWGRRCWEAS